MTKGAESCLSRRVRILTVVHKRRARRTGTGVTGHTEVCHMSRAEEKEENTSRNSHVLRGDLAEAAGDLRHQSLIPTAHQTIDFLSYTPTVQQTLSGGAR